jgi:hypothetical protein
VNNFCEHCGERLSKSVRFCEACGHPVKQPSDNLAANQSLTSLSEASEKFCEQCGTRLPKEAYFCEECGYHVEPTFQETEESGSSKAPYGHSRGRVTKFLLLSGVFIVLMVLLLIGFVRWGGVNKHAKSVSVDKEPITKTTVKEEKAAVYLPSERMVLNYSNGGPQGFLISRRKTGGGNILVNLPGANEEKYNCEVFPQSIRMHGAEQWGIFNPPVTIFRLPLKSQDSWTEDTFVSDPVHKPERRRFKVTVSGKEILKTPAGNFNCWKVEMVQFDSKGKIRYTDTTWYAKNIGVVRNLINLHFIPGYKRNMSLESINKLNESTNPDNKSLRDVFVLRATIDDPDGYTNVRSRKSASSEIITKVKEGEPFYTYAQSGDWWQIKTRDGRIGYMHVSRIKIVAGK